MKEREQKQKNDVHHILLLLLFRSFLVLISIFSDSILFLFILNNRFITQQWSDTEKIYYNSKQVLRLMSMSNEKSGKKQNNHGFIYLNIYKCYCFHFLKKYIRVLLHLQII